MQRVTRAEARASLLAFGFALSRPCTSDRAVEQLVGRHRRTRRRSRPRVHLAGRFVAALAIEATLHPQHAFAARGVGIVLAFPFSTDCILQNSPGLELLGVELLALEDGVRGREEVLLHPLLLRRQVGRTHVGRHDGVKPIGFRGTRQRRRGFGRIFVSKHSPVCG